MVYLSHGSQVFANTWQRLFITDLKVNVHQFVAKRGELVGKANFVLSCHCSSPSMRIVLLLHLLVNHILLRIHNCSVYIIMTSSDNLE